MDVELATIPQEILAVGHRLDQVGNMLQNIVRNDLVEHPALYCINTQSRVELLAPRYILNI